MKLRTVLLGLVLTATVAGTRQARAADAGFMIPSFDGGFMIPSFDGGFTIPNFDGGFMIPSFDGGFSNPLQDSGTTTNPPARDGGGTAADAQVGTASPDGGVLGTGNGNDSGGGSSGCAIAPGGRSSNALLLALAIGTIAALAARRKRR